MSPPENVRARGEVLEEAILDYLKGMDEGRAPTRAELIARFPEAAGQLEEFFADQDRLAPLLAPIRDFAGQPVNGSVPPLQPTLYEPTDPWPRIPGLEILGFLGKGGMGIVYKARQIRLNRVVALKMIRARRADDAAAEARFVSEGRTVARLDHPNIVSVYDSGEVEGQPYFVLEFVQGGTLAQKRKEGPWAPRAAASLVMCLADAVRYAHEQHIVHRDLKPANILLTPAGVPKIADFGLSKQLQADAGQLTRAGDCLGTPAYMPRELAEGRLEDVGYAADIFGLGAILYDLLTGSPPYTGDTEQQVREQARQGRIKPPRQVRPAVPRSLERICLRALAPDPRARHASAAALAQELRDYLYPGRRIAKITAGLAALVGLTALLWTLQSGAPDRGEAAGKPVPPAVAGDVRPATDGPVPASAPGHPEGIRKLLQSRCYRCHGQEGSVEGGFNYVLDHQQLVRRGLIVPGNAEGSRLYRRVREGQMPPEEESAALHRDEIALLKSWIDAGAPAFETPVARRAFIRPDEVLKLIRADLEVADKSSRPFLRYFSITHLFNAGLSDDELKSYRSGLGKLVNSLSWRQMAVPLPIDPAQTILRINLRDYGWNEETWKLILHRYPYGVIHDSEAGTFCAHETRCPLPVVRADWFVFEAARPPLYHQILQLPNSALELETKLGVNVAENVRQGGLARAGFNGSGIATNNRVIERHDSPYGAYWKSYDFAPAQGKDRRKNIFEHPLGPGSDKSSFNHDGGEIIFNLPNGLQAYFLVDAVDRRIDKGPLSIVSDKQQKDTTVTNGISCMRCHVSGIIEKDDQIREHVIRTKLTFPAGEVEQAMALYVPREKLRELMANDRKRFAQAVQKLGIAPGSTEPIHALASRFEWELDLHQSASEAGLDVQEFQKHLQSAPALTRKLGSLLNQGGTVQRQEFQANFGALVRELRLGTPYAGDSELLINSVGMQFKLLPASGAHKRYFIGVHEVTQGQFRDIKVGHVHFFSTAGAGSRLVQGQNTDSFPADSVSWNDALEFCKALSAREPGRVYRLPTEAEWEYACRAGTTTDFSFANGVLDVHGWYKGNAAGTPHAVGLKTPNPWGLYDMHGNLAEWCDDLFDPRLTLRLLRGGSWQSTEAACRSLARDNALQEYRHPARGFRVVLEANDNDLRQLGQYR